MEDPRQPGRDTDRQPGLRRELGFWQALTIGAGTMIGAGIFLLAGVALELTGPAAILSYLAAGAVCLMTAASAAELATGMPTSGGDYYFVSRSLGPAFGAISGVGIWLSLTFAIAFYLFGMGEFLTQLVPVSPFWGAVAGGVLLTALNVVGAKESGRTQVVVVLALIGILAVVVAVGATRVEVANFRPFFPFGTVPVAGTTALVFVSFLGFVKIAAVAEEVKDPERNLPRALIGSVALVTVLYVLIVAVIGGLFTQEAIVGVRDPLTAAARSLFGGPGALAIIFAGLLATLSSANASIMASSRINLAMARDRMFPHRLGAIHDRLLTPYRAILFTGLLALSFLLIDSLEELAKIASSLQLYSYAAINVGCAVLRASAPEWYRPSFRTPGYPFTQLVAAAGCLGIILYSGPLAQAIVVGLILVSLGWYAVWGRSRVEIRHAVPELKAAWAANGLRTFAPTEVPGRPPVEVPLAPEKRRLEPVSARRVMVALANPAHESDLLRMGRYIATGREEGGEVFGVHLVRVPLQTPLTVARLRFDERHSIEETIAALAEETADERAGRPLQATGVSAVTDVAHDVFSALVDETEQRRADLLLMGWQGGLTVGRIYQSPVQRVMASVAADVAVLKNRGLSRIRSILLPWGGGIHARLGLEVAIRTGEATGADVDLLRVVKPEVDREREARALEESVTRIVADYPRVRYLVEPEESVSSGIHRRLEEGEYDLVIIGASRESRLRNVLFGSIPDVVADRAPCSVLMVRRHVPATVTGRVSEGLKRLREVVGLTTSPEEP